MSYSAYREDFNFERIKAMLETGWLVSRKACLTSLGATKVRTHQSYRRPRFKPAIRLAASATLLLLLSGCGTLRGVISTTIHPNLSVSRTVEMTATGMFANLLANSGGQDSAYIPDDERAKVESYWDGSDYHLMVEANGLPADAWRDAFQQDTLERSYFLFVSYYRYRSENGPQQQGQTQSSDDAMAESMASAMVSMEQTVTMPGTIIESNADRVQESTASWQVQLRDINQGYEVQVVSRRVNVPEVVVAMLLLAGGVGFSIYRRHRTRTRAIGKLQQRKEDQQAEAAGAQESVQSVKYGPNAVDDAKTLIDEGNTRDAARLMEAYLNDHPDDASGWAALGAACFELEDWTRAEEAARRVVDMRPDSARDWCNLGAILRKQQRFDEAARAQHRALKADVSYERARVELRKVRSRQTDNA